MLQSAAIAIHCINPTCSRPYPHAWGNKFCQRCGSPLLLQGRYLPLQRIGSGGFAVTYTAYDLQTQTERVLKVLMEPAPKAIELFEQEAAVLASLDHPGVPRVEPGSYFQVHLGQRSLPCLVMEKINGHTLQDMLDQHPQGCPEAWVVDWFAQAVEILRELHRRQIIHRDLKPANLMLRQDTGQLVMIDFGGAKMRSPQRHLQVSSTRLVSPGYSPPEQIAGGNIQPASDFYALGRTLIHLLTGRYPADLEDPVTGELRWRSFAQVSPLLADLLDDLVQVNLKRRPASAEAVQLRLARIVSTPPPGRGIAKGLARVRRGTVKATSALFQMIVWMLKALLDTLWSVVLGGIGGSLGAAGGFTLAYRSPFGVELVEWLNQQLAQLAPNLPFQVGAEFLLFGLAGLGTAWGLTAAGGFGQRRRFWIAGLMGILSYWLGWLGLQLALPDGAIVSLAVFGAIAPTLLISGLGLASHHLTHTLVVVAGTIPFIVSLTLLNVWFTADLWQLLANAANPGSSEFWACIAFFGLLGSTLGCCLGISYYLFVPFLRLWDYH